MFMDHKKELRKELKFIVPAEGYHRAIHWIRHNSACFFKEYPDRQVNNIYFDSFNYDSYKENLAGISSRKKIRYRWYGPSITPIAGALELKYRHNQCNWKLICKINEMSCHESDSWQFIRRELMSRLHPKFKHHLHQKPMPALVNRYQRAYFRSRENNIRITLNSGLTFYKQGYISANFNRGVSLADKNILEIKFPVHLNNDALELMSNFPFSVSRSSKYCVGIRTGG